MSMFKYFAPPEWDADVPEISEGINLTKKNKLRKRVKYAKEDKNDDQNLETEEVKDLPLKRKNDPFSVITPKKKRKKNDSQSYIKFDSPKINNTMTDSFQLEINNVEKPVNKSKKNKNLKINGNHEEAESISIEQNNEIPIPKKKKKDKKKNIDLEVTDVPEQVVEKKKKKAKNTESNDLIDDISSEVHPVKAGKSKKQKKNKIEPMEVEKSSLKEILEEINTKQKNRKEQNSIEKKVLVSNKTILNDSDQSLNKKLSKKGKNKLKKDKKKLSQEPKEATPIEVPIEPICTVASQIVPNNKTNNFPKKSKAHVKKIKELLGNIKTTTETTEEINTNKNDDIAMLSSINDKIDIVEKKTVGTQKSLRERMMERIKGARFRYINEQLYVKQSNEAFQVFKDDPGAFQAYHNGYRQQINKWPVNPLDIIIKEILKLPQNQVVADLGCGDARLSKSVPHKVFSFDLVALDPSINACDMSHTPLLTAQVNVVVFCLSLMSTNLKDYLIEANRILKIGGLMKIAEVESRFSDIEQFMTDVKKYGFSILKKDLDHNLFYFIDFKKDNDIKKRNKLPDITLNPCLYKKR